MKNSIKCLLLLCAIFTVSTHVLTAQSTASVDADKQQILETINQWGQKVLIGQNLEDLKNFYPKNGVSFSIENQKIVEYSIEKTIKLFLSQFENIKYTSYNTMPDPYIFITEDGNTAIVYGTTEVEYEILKTNKKDKISLVGLQVLIKEDGKWVGILESSENLEERKVVVVDKSILDEYNGTYKSEMSGNVYTISNDGKNLIFTQKDGENEILIPQSECSFYREGESPTIVFGRNNTGKVSFYTYIDKNTIGVVNKIK